VYTAGRVVETILADDLIRGVTSVDDELFVLLDRTTKSPSTTSTTTNYCVTSIYPNSKETFSIT